MATDETKEMLSKGYSISLGSRNNMISICQKLFETLRSFDDKNVDIILSEAFEEKGVGVAIMNRLKEICRI